MNTVKCPKCGNENLNTNIKCDNCGFQLVADEKNQNMEDDTANTQSNSLHNFKIESFLELFRGLLIVIGGSIFSGVSSMFIFKGADNITKIAGVPFVICGLTVVIYGIVVIVREINISSYVKGKVDLDKFENREANFEKIGHTVNYLYIFGFLLFWFGFLIVFDVVAVKSWSEGGNVLFFFSLMFWVAGIRLLVKSIKER